MDRTRDQSGDAPATALQGAPRIELPILTIVVLGATLRTAYLGTQVVAGDEIHPITAASTHPLGYLLTHFHLLDYSMPIAAWCRLLILTSGLEEWGLRFLSFLPGILLVWVLARASRAFFEPTDRLLFAWLLACSPILIFWSREARPYAAVVLLGSFAVLSIVRYARERRAGWLAASAGCQAVMLYFSLTTLPFVASLSLASAVWSLSGSGSFRIRDALSMALPGAAGIVLAALLLLPAFRSLAAVVAAKSDARSTVTLETLADSARMVFGLSTEPSLAGWGLLVLLPTGLAALGLVTLFRDHRRLAPAVLILLVAPGIAYAVARFEAVGTARAFVRYQAALVPLYLALLVYGFRSIRLALARRSRPLAASATAIGCSLVGLLAILGPLRSGMPPAYVYGLLTSRLYHHRSLAEDFPRERVPAFYRERAGEDGVVIVEWPATFLDRDLLAVYQQLHGGRLVRGYPVKRDAALDLRTILFGLSSLRWSVPNGAYVVVHLRPEAERVHVIPGRVRRAGLARPTPERVVERCRELFGEPIYEDEWIVAFRRKNR